MPHSPEGQGQFSGALTPYPALPMHYPASLKPPPLWKTVAVLSEQFEHQGHRSPYSTPLNPQGPQAGLVSIPTEQVEQCAGSCSAIRGRTTLGALCPLPSLG